MEKRIQTTGKIWKEVTKMDRTVDNVREREGGLETDVFNFNAVSLKNEIKDKYAWKFEWYIKESSRLQDNGIV